MRFTLPSCLQRFAQGERTYAAVEGSAVVHGHWLVKWRSRDGDLRRLPGARVLAGGAARDAQTADYDPVARRPAYGAAGGRALSAGLELCGCSGWHGRGAGESGLRDTAGSAVPGSPLDRAAGPECHAL